MLQQLLVSQLFAFLLIFSRVGTGLMVMPGFGEVYVLARARLVVGLAISLLLTPILAPSLPAIPSQPLMVFILIFGEILVGLLLGGIARIMISAAHVAGTIVATQSSLASSMMFDFTHSGQSTTITNLFSFTAVILLFATNLHHVMLHALTDSYQIFTPGVMPPAEDFATFASNGIARAFAIAIQLAAPNVAIAIIVYLGAGVLARLMPSMQIFFILMVPQIMGSFFILMAVFSGLMMWYMQYFEDALMPFVASK